MSPRTVVRARRPHRPASRTVSPPRSRGYVTYTATVANAGDAPANVTVDVAGPTTGSGFYVANITTGKTLRVNYAVPASKTLVIDLAEKAARVDGVALAGVIDQANSQWWQLEPGNNTVVATVPATVKHRSAYR